MSTEKLSELKEALEWLEKTPYGGEWDSALVGGEGGKNYHAVTNADDEVVRTADDSRHTSWLCDYIVAASPSNIRALLAELDGTELTLNVANDATRIWKERALAAEAKLATPVLLPDTLAGIGEKLRTQDNRITSEPMFCVYQKREIVADAEYDHDRIVWVDEDGLEANERQRMRLEVLHDNCREVPAKWRRVAVKEIDEFVTGCFTEQGCKDYLACNGHNLRLPFIYVKSGFRNAEYIDLRNWLMTTGFTVEGDEQ